MHILISKSSRSCGEESPYKILLLKYITVLYLYNERMRELSIKFSRLWCGIKAILKVRHTLYFREVQTGYARHSFWPQLLAILNPKSSSGCGTVYGIWQVERHRDILLIVAPSLRNDHDLVPRAEIGGFSPRSAGAPPKRSDGASLGVISLRRSTPTPPGGVTQPVVGVAPAVLAPRRAPPGPAVDPRAGGPAGPRL